MYKKLLYYRYVDNPVTNFIDLMYLANISTFIFEDNGLTGFYLHGRNSAQHSDATLKYGEGRGGRGVGPTWGNPKKRGRGWKHESQSEGEDA